MHMQTTAHFKTRRDQIYVKLSKKMKQLDKGMLKRGFALVLTDDNYPSLQSSPSEFSDDGNVNIAHSNVSPFELQSINNKALDQDDGTIDTDPHNTSVSAVRPEFFMIRPVSQWLQSINIVNVPWNMTDAQRLKLSLLPSTVQIRLSTLQIRPSLFFTTNNTSPRLQMSSLDAHLFIQKTFPFMSHYRPQYMTDITGLHLLNRVLDFITPP